MSVSRDKCQSVHSWWQTAQQYKRLPKAWVCEIFFVCFPAICGWSKIHASSRCPRCFYFQLATYCLAITCCGKHLFPSRLLNKSESRNAENRKVFDICEGADMQSSRKLECWGYILAQGFYLLFLATLFPYQTRHALYFACVKKCLPAGLILIATTGSLKYSKGMKAWEARHRGAAVIAVLDKEVKPQRVQAYQCWKLDCKRLWVAANKSKKKKAQGKMPSREELS